ncbi:MAG: fatty acid desaturase [Nostoc sp. ChiSLP02]|nr:fatty acid desaturase [Nostoc sp. DedSLP05]MDZ8097096.1 fatty acid desaturase [Nostoc sp. DedSLP01]MDZ8188865.1 fatty acid desaturase [Nostoc sp. ChiSLP02]
MIQLQEALNHQRKLTLLLKKESSFSGLFIAIFIISVWAISLFFLFLIDISKLKFWMLCILIPWQTFLYTGLFITSHDAMHGVVFPQNSKINHFIGNLSLSLYGLLPYQQLLSKHWQHHRHPATQTDPDFHNGKHKNFLAWYFNFMKNYWNWGQIIAITLSYQFAHLILHIPHENLILFWVVPSLLSSLQLFYFGTFIPHSEPKGGYIQPHCAKTINFPIWLSFITCYHFGYHKQHHEYPHLAWWQLPEIYNKIK